LELCQAKLVFNQATSVIEQKQWILTKNNGDEWLIHDRNTISELGKRMDF
jgi:hypothetical protein